MEISVWKKLECQQKIFLSTTDKKVEKDNFLKTDILAKTMGILIIYPGIYSGGT